MRERPPTVAAVDDFARRERPASETAAALVDRLLDVRRRLVPDARPRPRGDRGIDRVRVLDDNPPLFCATLHLPEGELATVTIAVTVDPAHPVRPACDHCPGACDHALAALDELLDWLFDDDHERRDEVLEVAGTVPWRRWLDRLDEALEGLEAAQSQRRAARLWWQVDTEAESIVPFVETQTESGARTKPRRVRLDRIESEVDVTSSDRAAIASARLLKAERRAAARDGRGREVFLAALEGLVGHPRVSAGTVGGTPWRVERVPVRFTVDRRDDAVELDVHAGDFALHPTDLLGARGRAQTLLFERRDLKVLQLVSIEPALSKLLDAWAKNAVPVPETAQGELMTRLSRAAEHLDVHAADVIAERTVEPRTTLIAVLTPLPQHSLQIELRAQPLLGGPLLSPGSGPEQVLTSTPERHILRTTRDLWQEREIAATVMVDHDLDPLPDRPDTIVLEDLAAALAAAQALESDPRVECQWPKARWYPPVTVGADRLRLAVRNKRDWFGIHGDIEVSGKRVDLAVLLEAARRDRAYAPLGDGHFAELEQVLKDRLRALAPYLEPRRGALGISVAGADALGRLADGAATFDADEAWQALLGRMAAAASETPPLPMGLKADLRPYQMEGFVWLHRLATWGAGAVLADDMGLGKTVQAIALLCARADFGPQLVVAPTSVGFNWRRELARFAPGLEVVALAGPRRERALERAGPGVVFVTSYGVVRRDAAQLAELDLSTLVLDEAQALKNPRAQRARAVAGLRAEARVALTGTPVENHPADIWALFRAVFPGLLGTWESFRTRFLATAEEDGQAFGTGALGDVIRPYVLRRSKAEVAQDLPPRTEITVDVELGVRERALYDDARLSAIAEMQKREITEQTHVHMQVLRALTRLRQLACHPKLVDPRSRVPSSKLDRLLQILTDLLEERRRALVFSQFTTLLDIVKDALQANEIPFAQLDGRTPAAQRAAAVDRFQTGEVPVFLVSTKAGGTGLNLTAADTVIHLDPWWNPAVEDQATDRAHRLGQTQPVTVMRLVARDTIEHHMLAMNTDKRRLFNDLLDDKAQVGRLSGEELMALIRR